MSGGCLGGILLPRGVPLKLSMPPKNRLSQQNLAEENRWEEDNSAARESKVFTAASEMAPGLAYTRG